MESTKAFARVHDGGRSICGISPNGRYMVSCGADGSLNKYNFTDLENPKALDDPNQAHDQPFNDLSFCHSGDYFVTACEDGEASLFMFPTCSCESAPVRFDTPVVAAQFQPKRDSFLLAAASESGRIRLLNALSPASGDLVEWEADSGGIRYVRWHPSGDRIGVAGSDGSLTIFEFSDISKPPASVYSSKCFPKIRASNGAQRLCLDFNSEGTLLALPGHLDVSVLNTANWQQKFSLAGNHLNPTSIVRFSRSGDHIATGDTSGKVCVWKIPTNDESQPIMLGSLQLFEPEEENISSQEIMSQFANEPNGVGCIEWSADGETLIVTDCVGNLFSWRPPLSSLESIEEECPATLSYDIANTQESNDTNDVTKATEVEDSAEMNDAVADSSSGIVESKTNDDDFDLDMDVDDEDDELTLVGSSRRIIRRRRTNFDSESDSENEEKASQEKTKGGFFSVQELALHEAAEDGSNDVPASESAPPTQEVVNDMFDMSLSIDELVAAEESAEQKTKKDEVDVVEDVEMMDVDVPIDAPLDDADVLQPVLDDNDLEPIIPQAPIDDDHIISLFFKHAPFQSGNTPYDETRQRYLVWNEIGAVIGREDATSAFGTFQVEIDFCDKSLYPRSVRFRENRKFDVAALGTESLFLGSRGSESPLDTSIAAVTYHGFQSNWAGKIEWTHIFPENEGVLCVGVTIDYAVAATSMNYLRIFSKGGMQVSVLSLPGRPITIASSLVSNSIAITFETVNGLNFWTLDLERQKRIQEGKIVLSDESMLTWMYFGPNDMLLTVDTKNIMRALTRSFDWTWTPILDLNRGVVEYLQREQTEMHLSNETIENCQLRPICFDYVEGYDPALMTLILKPGQDQPSCTERPILTPIPLQIPVLNIEFDDSGPTMKLSFGAEEEAILRKDVMYQMGDRTNTAGMAQKFKKERVKSSVVLFQRACELNRQYLAYDIARLYLTSKKALLAAVKISTHLSLNSLAERINGLLRTREAERMERLERETMEREQLLMELNVPMGMEIESGGRMSGPPSREASVPESKSNSPEVTPPGSQMPPPRREEAPKSTFTFGRSNSLTGKRNRKKRRLEQASGEEPLAKRQALPFSATSNPKSKKQGGSLFDL